MLSNKKAPGSTSSLLQSLFSLADTEARHEKKKQAEIKAKLILAIATEYQSEIGPYRNTPPSLSVFSIYFREKITVAAYLKRFTDALENISVTALLHMTIVIDTFFRLKPMEKMTGSNCYGLILSSLHLTCVFNDESHDEADLFAKLAGVTSIQLGDMEKHVLSVIGSLRYTSARYHAAWGEYLPTYKPDQPKIEVPDEVKQIDGEKALQINKDDQKKIGMSLTRQIGFKLDRLISKNDGGYPSFPSAEYRVFYSATLPALSVSDYLARLYQYSHAGIETLIYTLITLDQYVESQPADCVGAFNVHRLVLTSFVLAYYAFEDACYDNRYLAKVGGVSAQELITLVYAFIQLVPKFFPLPQKEFAHYIYALSPDNARALGVLPPISQNQEENDDDWVPEACRPN